MIEKLIENWLINVNELGFQIPFCEVLVTKGYRIIHLSSHGPGEHGKDIIARDAAGHYWTFQLKGGDIRLSDWRAIRGEVEELVRLPITYPGIAREETHTPVLVTNGEIRGDARENIAEFALRWANDGAENLQVWARGELLGMFIEAHGNYLPVQLTKFRSFVELYVADFEDRLPRERFAIFLESLVAEEVVGARPSHIRRAIESTALTGAYILEQYERVGNYLSAAEGWTLVAAAILHIVEREGIAAGEHYESTLQLAWRALYRNLEALETEVSERNNLVVSREILAEPLFHPVRVTLVLGWLAVLSLIRIRFLAQTGAAKNTVREVIHREFPHLQISGEVDWPIIATLALYAEAESRSREADDLLAQWVTLLVQANRGEDAAGMPSPYWLHDKIFSKMIGTLPPAEDESFSGTTHTIMSAMDMLVRRLCRQRVRSLWPAVSRLTTMELRFDRMADWFLWNAKTGELLDLNLPVTVSWSQWRADAAALNEKNVPAVLLRHPEWILPIALTMPHRASRTMTTLIDTVIGRRARRYRAGE